VWDVEPLIVQGDRVIIHGEFGSLKSWLLLHLGLNLAAGHSWLGKFSISQPRRVLYVDEEMNERTLRRRVKRLGQRASLTNIPIPFQMLSRVGVGFDEKGADKLLKALAGAGFDPDVIIVDALRRVLLGNENQAEDVGQFWRNV
jgi:RecA-family ATPase